MKTQDMTRDWIATAKTLNQALPYMQRYAGAIVVIKLGGHAMSSQAAMEDFARDVVLSLEPPMATSMLNSLPVRVEALENERDGVVRVRLAVGHRAALWTHVTRQSVAALRLEPGRRLHALIRPEVLGVNH